MFLSNSFRAHRIPGKKVYIDAHKKRWLFYEAFREPAYVIPVTLGAASFPPLLLGQKSYPCFVMVSIYLTEIKIPKHE